MARTNNIIKMPRTTDEVSNKIKPRDHHAKKNEPQNIKGYPECPESLGDEAKAEWNYILSVLDPKLINKTDKAVLALYCDAWGEFVECTRAIKNYDGEDQQFLNALRKNKSDAWDRVLKISDRFGLDPKSRQKINLPDAGDAKGEFDEFL